MHKNCLAIRSDESLCYPSQMPFDPDMCFEEWDNAHTQNEKNHVYHSIRQCFIDMGMDAKNLNTSKWSPLSDIIVPGNTVVIKPNLVLNTNNPAIQECTTSHPSVIRVIADYVWKALCGRGLIIVGDAPGAEADFDTIIARNHLGEMVDVLQARGMNIRLEDFRAVRVLTENGVWIGTQATNINPPLSQIINMEENSLFASKKNKKLKLHGAGYDINLTTKHHRGTTQEYSVSQTVLQADVVISVPKFKTHRKAGITCCLKNLVGINTDKNYLPHFTLGSANMGGDEMPEISKKNFLKVKGYNWIRVNIIAHVWKYVGRASTKILRMLKSREKSISLSSKEPTAIENVVNTEKDIDLAKWFHNKLSGQEVAAGAWAGNETICRMILDLNRIFLCCDRDGTLRDKTDRKIFYVVDAIDIGMGNGPTHPIPAKASTIAMGFNGYQIDHTLLTLFDVDPECILLYRMAKDYSWMLEDSVGSKFYNGALVQKSDRLAIRLQPPDGWEYKKVDGV